MLARIWILPIPHYLNNYIFIVSLEVNDCSLTSPSVLNDEYGNCHSSLLGTQNGTATLEGSWQFFKKINAVLPYDPATALQDVHPDLKNYFHTKTQHTNVYRSFIHNNPKPEVTKMSFNRYVDKQTNCGIFIK